MLAKEGIHGLYNGLSASLTRQATYGTARIGLHRVFSQKLKVAEGRATASRSAPSSNVNRLSHPPLPPHHQDLNGGGDIPFIQKTFSGMLSGAIAVCIGTPFDVALVRMQNDGSLPKADRRNYSSVFDALAQIQKKEGVTKLLAYYY